jgi:hypothetical protein
MKANQVDKIRIGTYVEAGRIPASGISKSFQVSVKRLKVDPKLRKSQPGFEVIVERSIDGGKTFEQLARTNPKYLEMLEEALIGQTRQLFGFSPPTHKVLE